MILVLGSSRDQVYPRLVRELRSTSHPYAVVDEDNAALYDVRSERVSTGIMWKVRGGECDGSRPVGAIFVRHAVARTLDPRTTERMGSLQAALNRMLLSASCPVANQPSNALSNYAKPYQTNLLADAGFDVPRTLVTNLPAEALRFYEECEGQVIVKGVSNVTSFARLLTPERFGRLALLPNSPTQFQEYVAGVDYRVHVIGDRAFVTRLSAANEDYRRAALEDDQEILAEPAELPECVIDRCVTITRQLGLIVSGIDFKESAVGRLVALELNPFPQFTFYEGRTAQPITREVVQYLVRNQDVDTNVLA